MPAPNDLPEWATAPTFPAGPYDWSGQPPRVFAALAGLAATGHIPDTPTDAETFNAWLGLLSEWISYFRDERGRGVYGDGSDGIVTLAAGVTASTRDMFYERLIIPAGATFRPSGFRTFVRDVAIVEAGGIWEHNGASGVAAATVGAAGAVGGSLGAGGAGGAGGAATLAGAASPNTPAGAIGGAGGSGGNSNDGGAGGAGGGIVPPLAAQGGWRTLQAAAGFLFGGFTGVTPTGILYGGAGGAGGGGGTSGTGGAGGGAGGIMSTWARFLENAGTIRTNGGEGSSAFTGPDAAGNGGGGGGGGGVHFLATRGYSGAGILQALGGAGGAGHLIGSPGSAGAPGTVLILDA